MIKNFFKMEKITSWIPWDEVGTGNGHGFHNFNPVTGEGYGYFYNNYQPSYKFETYLDSNNVLNLMSCGLSEGCFWQEQGKAEKFGIKRSK